MPAPSSNRSLLLLTVAAVALAGGLLLALAMRPDAVVLQSGTLLPQPRALPELNLLDDQNQPYAQSRLQKHWTLIFPGYTSCPDICPTTMALLKQVLIQLGPQAEQLQVAMLTVDPERDTPERLGQYLHYFNPHFLGLITPEPNLKRVAQTLGVVYVKVPGESGSYTMDHSAALVLLDPQGRLAGYLTPPFTVDALVQDFRKLLKSGA
ncbi:protein SCO1/2 [Solimonas aquatica]|uniref:Protein SCO1/2 n=1 Tax=Solimonas aquatica TaxID=489703 RepID=A0A1H8ZX42_9GAMM|nr:SCO family protein [Solimonas aquatica]SEP69030.1 protein SCO1/2 [Solimonas aquatica]